MKAIVTGGAGFIGSHLADRLLDLGVRVVIFDDFSSGKEENLPAKAIFRQVDISSWDELLLVEDDFADCDVIFHNAASKKNICLRDPSKDLSVNGNGTLMLLQLAKNHSVKKFVHASTGSVYGEVGGVISEHTPTSPVSYYGVSKLAGERYVQVFNHIYGMNTTIIRYFHVYGARQEDNPALGGVVAVFKRQALDGGPLTIHGDGEQERVFTHVSDVVEANIRAWQYDKSFGQVYNCCTTEPVSILALAHKVMGIYGKCKVEYGPPLIGDIRTFLVDSGNIQADLGMSFLPFREGIKKI